MPTVRLWSLEPDYDAESIKRLADELLTHLRNLEIYPLKHLTETALLEAPEKRGDIRLQHVAKGSSELPQTR